MKFPTLLSVLLAAAVSAQAQNVLIDESVDGDLSDVGATPTDLGVLSLGSNEVNNLIVANAAGVTDPGFPTPDVDIFTFTIPDGLVVSSILLTEFVSSDDLGFMAIAAGSAFPLDSLAGGSDVSGIIGGALFGQAEDIVFGVSTPVEILPDIVTVVSSAGTESTGTTLPLGPGEFTILAQQLGTDTIELSLDIVTVPEASSIAMAAIPVAAVGIAVLRRRRRAG